MLAEEVAEIAPDLVRFDEEGRPFSVHYHLPAPVLLNEMQKQQRVIEAQTARIATLEAQSSDVEALRALEGEQRELISVLVERVERLEARQVGEEAGLGG